MSDELRALTVMQPHAWAITEGLKDVENRTWRFPLPLGSTIALHAGAKYDADGLTVDVPWLPTDLPARAIVALVDIVGDHHASECERPDRVRPYCSPWALPRHRHWELVNVRALRYPEPCVGRLWLFRVPSLTAERVRRDVC